MKINITYTVVFILIIILIITLIIVFINNKYNENTIPNTIPNTELTLPSNLPPEVLAQLLPTVLPTNEGFTMYENFEYSDRLSVENIRQLKIGQKKMSNMLKEFDRICTQYNIRYFLVGGSVIGALLYKGWIPWDSDVDLEIHEDDYNIFTQVIQKELPDTMWFQTYETDKYYFKRNRIVAKIRDLNSCYSEYSNAGFNKWHNGLQIDINIYREINGKLIMMDDLKTNYLTSSDIYPLKRVPFEDFTVSIMNNSEKYLDRKFGVKWRTVLPKHLRFGHEGRVDGENTCDFHYDKYPELYSNSNRNSDNTSELIMLEKIIKKNIRIE